MDKMDDEVDLESFVKFAGLIILGARFTSVGT
jgi:hypothetical protein